MYRKSFIFLVCSFLIASSALYSASAQWTGNAGNNIWNDDNNWNAAFPNGVNDEATFPNPITVTIDVTAAINVESIDADTITLLNLTGAAISINKAILALSGKIASIDNNLILTEAALYNFVLTPSVVYNGNISGAFTSIRFSGLGTPSHTFATVKKTYTVPTLINATATLNINVPVSTSSISSVGAGTLNFGGGATLTYAGDLTGATMTLGVLAGTTLNMTGGTTTYGGATTVTGTLNLSSTLTNSTVTVNGTLTGNGTITNTLNNNGTVTPGISSSTNLTAGTYTQTAAGTLNIRINTGVSSQLIVTGGAALDGTLLLTIGAGVYPVGTTFTVLTTGTGITGDFATFTETHIDNWQKQIVGNNVQVVLTSATIITPVSLSSLAGNSSIVGNYMFSDANFVLSNPDLTLVATAMTALNAGGFVNSLIEVSPLALAAGPQVALQSNVQMAVVLDKQFQQKVKDARRNKAKPEEETKTVPCYGIPKTGLFIEPIGVFYHQRQTGGDLTNQGQVAFDSYTYGAGMGWEQVLDGQFVVEGGIGYTHSNLHWHENFGNSRWSTIYVAPFFGWFNERFFANFMVMGGFNFFKTDRTVAFGTINRNAESKYNSYDLLVRINGGARIPFGNINWFQPEATLNYLTIFTEGYTETGASSINLQVQKNTTYIMQPSFRGKWIQEFKTKKFCYSPILYVGWLANIMLQPQTVSARFRDAPNRIFFNIEGYTGTVNQLILGAEFFVQRFNQFEITSTFEVDMLSHFEVYTGKVKFEWMF